MKSLSVITFIIAIIAFSLSFVSAYLQFYSSSRITELKKEQVKLSEDLLKLQQQLAESWKSEKGHAGNMHNHEVSENEWPKFHEATATVKFIAENRVVVDQEEMPGFMRAMMMSYKVENPDQLKNIDENDKVSLKLKETDTDLTVIEINKLED